MLAQAQEELDLLPQLKMCRLKLEITAILLSRETVGRNTDFEIHTIAPEISRSSSELFRESRGIQRNTGTLAWGRGVLFTMG